MQEDIDRKIITLSVSSAKMTGRVFFRGYPKILRQPQNKQGGLPKGRKAINIL